MKDQGVGVGRVVGHGQGQGQGSWDEKAEKGWKMEIQEEDLN